MSKTKKTSKTSKKKAVKKVKKEEVSYEQLETAVGTLKQLALQRVQNSTNTIQEHQKIIGALQSTIEVMEERFKDEDSKAPEGFTMKAIAQNLIAISKGAGIEVDAHGILQREHLAPVLEMLLDGEELGEALAQLVLLAA